ncbi:MAG: hypothetical protein ACO3AD_04395 [Burkholderiaceae bacterium]
MKMRSTRHMALLASFPMVGPAQIGGDAVKIEDRPDYGQETLKGPQR